MRASSAADCTGDRGRRRATEGAASPRAARDWWLTIVRGPSGPTAGVTVVVGRHVRERAACPRDRLDERARLSRCRRHRQRALEHDHGARLDLLDRAGHASGDSSRPSSGAAAVRLRTLGECDGDYAGGRCAVAHRRLASSPGMLDRPARAVGARSEQSSSDAGRPPRSPASETLPALAELFGVAIDAHDPQLGDRARDGRLKPGGRVGRRVDRPERDGPTCSASGPARPRSRRPRTAAPAARAGSASGLAVEMRSELAGASYLVARRPRLHVAVGRAAEPPVVAPRPPRARPSPRPAQRLAGVEQVPARVVAGQDERGERRAAGRSRPRAARGDRRDRRAVVLAHVEVAVAVELDDAALAGDAVGGELLVVDGPRGGHVEGRASRRRPGACRSRSRRSRRRSPGRGSRPPRPPRGARASPPTAPSRPRASRVAAALR